MTLTTPIKLELPKENWGAEHLKPTVYPVRMVVILLLCAIGLVFTLFGINALIHPTALDSAPRPPFFLFCGFFAFIFAVGAYMGIFPLNDRENAIQTAYHAEQYTKETFIPWLKSAGVQRISVRSAELLQEGYFVDDILVQHKGKLVRGRIQLNTATGILNAVAGKDSDAPAQDIFVYIEDYKSLEVLLPEAPKGTK